MAQDIEEFLRMAAAKKKQQAQQAGQAPPANQANQPAEQPPAQLQQSAQPPSTQQRRQQKRQQQRRPGQSSGGQLPSSQREPDIYIGVDDPAKSSHPNLESRIRSTLSTEDIAEHTSHLGENVHSRQDFVQSRVEQKFDHDLGRLQKKELSEPAVVDHGHGKEDIPDLSFVYNMLMNPGSAKQAFILKEIFDRPRF